MSTPFGSSTKRKAYFAFHFEDIMRVNNVRNCWKIDHPDSSLNRSFYDSSLWESKKLSGDEAVKRLIRAGVEYTSAVCVLIGSDTYQRQWVRYEIARSVVDQRGLLAVHINGLTHHQTKTTHLLGPNPLDYMGVARNSDGRLYLCEWTNGQWVWYADYTQPISLPAYLPVPVGYGVQQLSAGTIVYDYVANMGHKNIGSWIDVAATRAGR